MIFPFRPIETIGLAVRRVVRGPGGVKLSRSRHRCLWRSVTTGARAAGRGAMPVTCMDRALPIARRVTPDSRPMTVPDPDVRERALPASLVRSSDLQLHLYSRLLR
jgi:hypothetical protein